MFSHKFFSLFGLIFLACFSAFAQPRLISFTNNGFPLTDSCNGQGVLINSTACILVGCLYGDSTERGAMPRAWNVSSDTISVVNGYLSGETLIQIDPFFSDERLHLAVTIPHTTDLWVSENIIPNDGSSQEFNLIHWTCEPMVLPQWCDFPALPEITIALNEPTCVDLCRWTSRNIYIGPLSDSTQVPLLSFTDSVCCLLPIQVIWNQEWAWSIQDGLHYYRTQLQGGSGLYGMIKVTPSLETTVNELPPLPQIYSLAQNYPNPFNPVTTIEYTLGKSEKVTLKIYDILGQEVKTLVEGNQTAGVHKVEFDGGNLASGIYLARLEVSSGRVTDPARRVEVKKMMLLK